MKPSRWNLFARLRSRRQNNPEPDQPVKLPALEPPQDTQEPLVGLSAHPLDGTAGEQEGPQPKIPSADDEQADQAVANAIATLTDQEVVFPPHVLGGEGNDQAPAAIFANEPAEVLRKPEKAFQQKPRAAATRQQPHPQPGAATPLPDASSSSARNPLFSELTTLDEEVRVLRRQLAQKLQAQNRQLKKMLERFERP